MTLMPWCPNCQKEVDNSEVACPDCGAALTDRSQEESVTETDDVPAFLTSVDDGISAEMLKARLTSAGIPCMLKPHRSGGFLRIYMAPNNLGADFFVPSRLLLNAREAIDLNTEDSVESISTDEISAPAQTDTDSAAQEPSKGGIWGNLLVIAGIALVLIAFFSLDALLDYIRKLMGY
jgi:hypothetical protein